MTKCAFAVFLLLALAGQTRADEMIRVSMPPLAELEYPDSFELKRDTGYDEHMKLVRGLSGSGGVGLKTALDQEMTLLTLHHQHDTAGAAIALTVGPPSPDFMRILEGNELHLNELAKNIEATLRGNLTQKGFEVINCSGPSRTKLRNGMMVMESGYRYRMQDGRIFDARVVLFCRDTYTLSVGVDMSPNVQSSTLAEIQTVINSVRLLADEPVAGSGQGGKKAKTADGLIRFAEPRVIELAYPETFAPDEKEMLAAADKANDRERLLLLLVHRDPEAAEVAVVLGDPSEGMNQENTSDYTVDELLETVERSSKQQIEIYAKQGGTLNRPMRARNLTLPGGVKATNFEHQERTMDGTLYDRRSIEIYTDRFYLNVFITTSPKVAASTLADIEKVVNSIQFYAGAEKIFTPATWSVAEKSSNAEPPADGKKSTTAEIPPAETDDDEVSETKPVVKESPWLVSGSGWQTTVEWRGFSPGMSFGLYSALGSLVLGLLMAVVHYLRRRWRHESMRAHVYLYLLGYYMLLWPWFLAVEVLLDGKMLLVAVIVLAMTVPFLYVPAIFCLRRKKWAFWVGSVMCFQPLLWIGSIIFACTAARKVWPKAAVSSRAAPPPPLVGTQVREPEPAPYSVPPPLPKPAAVAPPAAPAPAPAVVAVLPSQVDYLVHDGTHQYGPMPLGKLRGQVADGWLSKEHHYWHEAEAAWKPLAELLV